MSRKILSLIVAVAFVLTTISTAFAATLPTDVTADYAKAVSKVQALNIMIGDAGTGLFRPTDTIKRSEFAVVAVKAMGLNDTAIISAGATKFSDVAADNWASGYINAAVGAGLISGYPDGTYQPDKTINYAEAVTILANMLGYGPVLAGKAWPSAYVAQANASGVTAGVVMAPTVGASRGNVAKLVSNTLDSKMVKVSTYDINGKPEYTVGTTDLDTLLAQKLKIYPLADSAVDTYKTFWVTSTPTVQNSSTIDNSILINTDSSTSYSKGFIDALNADDYLGLDAKLWVNDDKKIVTVEIQNDASDVYTGQVEPDSAKLKLTAKGISYDFASDFKGYVDNVNVSATPAAVIAAVTDPNKGIGTVILKDGKVRFANIYTCGDQVNQTAATTSQYNKTFTVKEITDGYIKAYGPNVPDIKVQDVKDNTTKKTVRYDIIKDGAVATIDAVKVGDVVTRIGSYDSNSSTKHERWLVSSTEVKGNLASVDGTGATMKLIIGGKEYKVATFNSLKTWSFNNGDDWDKSYSDVKDIIGKDVTVKLNAAGQVAYLCSTSGSTTYYYGVVRSFASNVGANLDDAVTLYKADGTKMSYVFDKIADVQSISSSTAASVKYFRDDGTNALYCTINQGDLVQYQMTSDGKIKEGTLRNSTILSGVNYDQDGLGYSGAASALHDNYIVAGGGSGIINTASALFNTNPMAIGDDAQIMTFSTIDGKVGLSYKYVVKDNIVKALAANNSTLAASKSGVVVGTGYDADGVTITVNEAGTAKTYKNDGIYASAAAYLNAGTYIEYKVGSNGKMSNLVADATTAAFTVGYNNASTFNASSVHIFRVISIDTSSKVIKLEHLNTSTLMATTTGDQDYYFRYDTANLDVYNVKGKGDTPVSIIGGKSISDVQANDYVWVGGSSGSAYDFSKMLILKVDDINKY